MQIFFFFLNICILSFFFPPLLSFFFFNFYYCRVCGKRNRRYRPIHGGSQGRYFGDSKPKKLAGDPKTRPKISLPPKIRRFLSRIFCLVSLLFSSFHFLLFSSLLLPRVRTYGSTRGNSHVHNR